MSIDPLSAVFLVVGTILLIGGSIALARLYLEKKNKSAKATST